MSANLKQREIFFLNDSVSVDSGGRVQSMFLRSKTWEKDVLATHICTFNFRPQYRNIFNDIHKIKKITR